MRCRPAVTAGPWHRRTVLWPRFVVLGLALLATAPALSAADENTIISPRAAEAGAPASASGSALNSLSLFAAVLLAGAGAWIYWKNRRTLPVGRDRRALAVDETRSLGNRQFLVVASYEGRKFLLGVCPGRIDLLAQLNDREAPAAPLPPSGRNQG